MSELESQLADGMIDSHLHLSEMERKGLDPLAVLSACFAAGLEYALDIGISTAGFDRRREWAAQQPGLHLAAGLHPVTSAEAEYGPLLSDLASQLNNPAVVALGETGLDRFRMYAPMDRQRYLFDQQLKMAAEREFPVIIHNRDADNDILAALDAVSPAPGRGIMHCFSSGPQFAEQALARGFHVSFAGNLTYKKADEVRAAARMVPWERLLVETDAPYLAPQARRGRINHPGLIGHTYAALAELRGVSLPYLIDRVRENYRMLFRVTQ